MSQMSFHQRQYLEGWCKHLLWLNWSFAQLIHKKQAISDTTDRISEFWLQILNLHTKLVLVMYNMSYSGVVSSVPFLIIIIVFAPVITTDQIWWWFSDSTSLWISHLLTYKSSHVELVLGYLSIICIILFYYLSAIQNPYWSSIIQCLLAIVRLFSLNSTKKGS